jgi:hypothetical protein
VVEGTHGVVNLESPVLFTTQFAFPGAKWSRARLDSGRPEKPQRKRLPGGGAHNSSAVSQPVLSRADGLVLSEDGFATQL